MNSQCIFVVEDEFLVALNIQRQLQKDGFSDVQIYSEGEEALQQIHDHKPHLVLLDVQLDGDLTGIDVARKIREIYEPTIVFMSANFDMIVDLDDPEWVNQKYITKPFQFSELKQVLNTIAS